MADSALEVLEMKLALRQPPMPVFVMAL
jgi:hypothetical protein